MFDHGSMNRVYRVVWNAALGVWQAVGEIGKGAGKSKSHNRRHRAAIATLAGGVFLVSANIYAAALPSNGVVTSGAGSITQSNANTLNITQATNKMAIDWQSFSIGQGNTVNFIQPSSSSIALNRVTGTDVSSIQGALNANGQVFLINPNGVLFSTTAQVNVGGLVASTRNITNDDFNAGNYRFSGSNSSAIVNQGNIKTADGGYVVMIAATIENAGSISANKGSVQLGAGDAVLVDMGGPVKIEVQQGTLNSIIKNSGSIRADGGHVLLTAKAAGDLASSVINNTGIIEAQTLATGEKGEILLLGDMSVGVLNAGGKLDASAPNGGDGGHIETSAANVNTAADLQVTAGAVKGKSGDWLVDPVDFTIATSGGNTTGATISNTLNGGTDVTILSSTGNTGTSGDINVNDAISWSSSNKLTLNAQHNININADITLSNSASLLALEYGQGAVAAGNTADYIVASSKGIILPSGGSYSEKLGSDGATVTTYLGGSAKIWAGGNYTNQSFDASGNAVPLTWTVLGSDSHMIALQPVGSAPTFNTVATAFGMSASDVSYINNTFSGNSGGKTPTNFAYAYKTVSLTAGQSISSAWNYMSTDYVPWNDGSLVSFKNISNSSDTTAKIYGQTASTMILGATNPGTGNWSTGSYGSTGWQNSVLTAGQAGTYKIGYATFNLGDTQLSPYLYLSPKIGTTLKAGVPFGPVSVDPQGPLAGNITVVPQTPTVTSLNYTLGSVSKTYQGSAYNLSDLWTSTSIFGSTGSALVAGTDYKFVMNGQDVTGFTNAGTYNSLSISLLNSAYALGTSNTAGSFTITPASLTLSNISAANKIYDGNNLASVTASLAGLLGNDASAISKTISATFDSKNVGTRTATVNSVVLSGTAASNYTIATGQTANADITKATLGITGAITANNKVYDGNTAAVVNATNATLTKAINTDDVSVSSSGLFADKNVGNGKSVAIALTGADAGNYQIGTIAPSVTANITPRSVAITGGTISVTTKTYDGTDAATVSVSGSPVFNNMISNDNLSIATGNNSGHFSDKNAGTGKSVSIVLDGADKNNYVIDAQPQVTGTITPKALNISGTTTANKVYDGGTSATTTAGTLSGFVGNESVSTTVVGSFSDKNVATGKTVTDVYTLHDGANGGLASNYTLANDTSTANITPRAIQVSTGGNGGGTISVTTKTYDGTDIATVVVNGNPVLTNMVEADNLVIKNSGKFNDKNAGGNKTVTIALDGTDAGNYVIESQPAVTGTITPKALTIQGTNTSAKTYDGGTTASTTAGTLRGFVGNESVSTTVVGTFVDKNAATGKTVNDVYTLHDGANGGLASNYTLASDTSTANINQRLVTVTVDGKQMYVGDTDPAFTYSVEQSTNAGATGLLSGDQLTGKLTRAAGTIPGSYQILQGTLGNPNYRIDYKGSSLRIDPSAPITSAIQGAQSIPLVTAPTTPTQAFSATAPAVNSNLGNAPVLSVGGMQTVQVSSGASGRGSQQATKTNEASVEGMIRNEANSTATGIQKVFVVDGGIRTPVFANQE